MNTGAHHGVIAGTLKFKDPRDPPRHSFEYASLTIAANGLLVRYPNDPLRNPRRPNDGGQLFGALASWSKVRPIPKGPPAMGHGKGFYGGRIVAYENSPVYDYACGDATHSYSPSSVKSFTRQFVYLRPDVFVIFDRVTAFKPEFTKTWVLHTPAKPVPNAAGAEKPDTRNHSDGHFLWTCDGGEMTNKQGGRLFWKALLPSNREVRLLGGPHHDFEVEGVNRGPTDASYSEQVATRRAVFVELANLAGWRIEMESQNRRETETFLNVLQAAERGVAKMAPVEKISGRNAVGVRVTVGARIFEVTFATEGDAGGHVKLTENGRALVDRDLADQVHDSYTRWKDEPQHREWMTNPHMRSVIGAEERDAYTAERRP